MIPEWNVPYVLTHPSFPLEGEKNTNKKQKTTKRERKTTPHLLSSVYQTRTEWVVGACRERVYHVKRYSCLVCFAFVV